MSISPLFRWPNSVNHYTAIDSDAGTDDSEEAFIGCAANIQLAKFITAANPAAILEIAAAFRQMQQRAEAAEAQLAELAAQEPVKWQPIPFNFNQLKLIHGKEFARGYCAGWLRKCQSVELMGDLFSRPTPAVNLAELVPDEIYGLQRADQPFESGKIAGFNSCRSEMLRRIDAIDNTAQQYEALAKEGKC
ncbi:hypothetical protein [Mixta theicola]|nr:hypothetical protein [Mixta theicola]